MKLNVQNMTDGELKKKLGEAIDDAKKASESAPDHTDENVAEAVGRAHDIWKELSQRGVL